KEKSTPVIPADDLRVSWTRSRSAFRGLFMLPSKDKLTICFAHVAYRLQERFRALDTGIDSFEVRDAATLERRIGEADALVISGPARNRLVPQAHGPASLHAIGARPDPALR